LSGVNKEDKDDIWKKMESKRKMGSPLQRRFNSKTTIFENLVVDPYFYPIPLQMELFIRKYLRRIINPLDSLSKGSET